MSNKTPDMARLPASSVGGQVEGGVRVCPRRLAITRHVRMFAPGAAGEQFSMDYTVTAMPDAALRIVVTDRGQRVVHQVDLPSPVSGTFTWDGRALDGRWITPFGSRFKVRIYNRNDEDESDHVRFRVEYHSVRIKLGRWAPVDGWTDATPAQHGADEPRWVRFMLNQLGYAAGPLAGGLGNHDRNAATRYRATHATLAFNAGALRWTPADFPATGAALAAEPDRVAFLAALANGDGRRPWLTRPAGPGRQQLAAGDPLNVGGPHRLRVHVEALAWMGGANPAVNELQHQYPPGATRAQREHDRLNRPLIPLEVDIFLRGTDGSAKSSPEAVGAARINWTFEEPAEDLGRQIADDPATSSYPRSYVTRALAMHGGRASLTSDNNCHADYGGIRTTDGTNYRAPFVLGGHYPPYATEDGGNVVRSIAHEGAVAACRGKAGILFCPSFIAGDAYKIKAAIHPRHLHPETPPDADETNVIEVWRDAEVAAVLGWPPRGDLTPAVWQQVKDEYEKAYVDLDVSAVAGPMLPITNYLQPADYQAWFQAFVHAKHGGTLTNALSVGSMLTLQNPLAQGAENEAADAADTAAMAASFDDLWRRIATRTRAHHPRGAILVAYQNANLAFVGMEPDTSMSMPNFGVILNRATRGKTYFITAHELAHCLFLNHAQTAAPNADTLADHDAVDQNCMMGYGLPNLARSDPRHWLVGLYTPHFCGRCNLKLRGWDLLAVANPLPRGSAEIVACTWAADHVPIAAGRAGANNVVALVVETRRVPDGTSAQLRITRQADGSTVQTMNNLVVLKDLVCVRLGEIPQFRDDTPHPGGAPWVPRRYLFDVRIQVATQRLTAVTATPLDVTRT